MRYRRADGQFADTTLDRLAIDDVVAGLPVREFRSYKGRQRYSGWYWSAVLRRLVVYESRLELALNRTLRRVVVYICTVDSVTERAPEKILRHDYLGRVAESERARILVSSPLILDPPTVADRCEASDRRA